MGLRLSGGTVTRIKEELKRMEDKFAYPRERHRTVGTEHLAIEEFVGMLLAEVLPREVMRPGSDILNVLYEGIRTEATKPPISTFNPFATGIPAGEQGVRTVEYHNSGVVRRMEVENGGDAPEAT